jgi:hypothetical protein
MIGDVVFLHFFKEIGSKFMKIVKKPDCEEKGFCIKWQSNRMP